MGHAVLPSNGATARSPGGVVPEPTHDLGMTLKLSADAVGEPGQRRFRLLVEAQRGSACLWMEKDQLLQLSGSGGRRRWPTLIGSLGLTG